MKSQNVESFVEVSRDEAWVEFQSQISENLKPLLNLDFNPLPGSYKVNFHEVDNRWVFIRKLAAILKNQKGVESVEYGEEWIMRFEKFMVFTKVFLFGMGILLCLGIILIISNTIRLSIYSRQDEIELMLLIGATPRFVKIPFLLFLVRKALLSCYYFFTNIGILLSYYLVFSTSFNNSNLTKVWK